MQITDDIKNDLKRLVWDYEVDAAQLTNIFLGKTRTFSLTREKLCSRLLMSTSWYKLLDHFGTQGLREILNDEAIRLIWIRDLREKFLYAQNALRSLP